MKQTDDSRKETEMKRNRNEISLTDQTSALWRTALLWIRQEHSLASPRHLFLSYVGGAEWMKFPTTGLLVYYALKNTWIEDSTMEED